MKAIRLSVLCSLLLLAAVPCFAIQCRTCEGEVYPYCISMPNSASRCEIGLDYCIDRPSTFCIDARPAGLPAMLSEWSVASIEERHPSDATQVVTTPSVIAELRSAQR